MSSAPSPESVEQTKQQIRGLINEIADLSRSEIPGEEYFPAILKRIVDALAAVGGAIWLLDEAGSLRLSYQININSNLVEAENEDGLKHGRLLARLFQRGKSELIPPFSMIGQDQNEGNPTQYLLVVAPLSSGKQNTGIIEVFQRPDSAPNVQKGYQRFLEQMAGLIGEWLKGHSLQQVADRQVMWQQADHFARLVHDNLDARDTAFTIANEGRQLIGCDRVSVAIKRGRNCKIEAISGQDTIENRSNIVTSLNHLASRVIAAGESLWYDGSVEDLPPQLEEAVEDYVDLSHGRAIVVLPIRRPEKLVAGDVQSKQSVVREDANKNEIIGALIIEQIESQVPSDVLKARCDLVYEHAARALNNSMAHSDLFMMPAIKTLTRATWLFRGSAFPKTMTVLAIATVALLALFIVRIDFKLNANGTLRPKVQRQVFAHENGEIEDVYVDHGSVVKAGDPLVKMRNRELDIEYERVTGELQTVTQDYQNNLRLSTASRVPEADKNQYAGQAAQLIVRQESLLKQKKLLEERRQQLIRTSPIDGIVLDWKLAEKLRLRPVVTGQVLVNIADTNQAWEVELLMPEKRMKHLDEARKTSIEKNQGQPLKVEYILYSDTNTTRTGKMPLDAVHERAQLDTEDGTVVKLRVEPDSLEGINLRTNTEVNGSVVCGRASAAYVWFHEVGEWFQSVRFKYLF